MVYRNRHGRAGRLAGALADSSTMDPGAKTIEDATDMTLRAIRRAWDARFDREDANLLRR